ncbi:hypothetical protein K440DRAFT_622769 [Wilcoxina mikolae CBS 423.85]|nr:hypothetical protein K440DRAFT_622769 [Wilcoxina mikolae CBS 423.85]
MTVNPKLTLFAPAAKLSSSTGGELLSSAQSATSTNKTTPATKSGLIQLLHQSHQMISAVTLDATKLTITTRFGDCHQSVQQALEQIDTEIQYQISMSGHLADHFLSHLEALQSIPLDSSVLSNRLATTKLLQLSDQATYDLIRANHDADDAASTLSIRTLDLFRLPHAQRSQCIQRNANYSSPQRENDVTGNKPMITYFNKYADDMQGKMVMMTRIVQQVEDSLLSVEAQATEGSRGAHDDGRNMATVASGVIGRHDTRKLNSALKEFNMAMKTVSGSIVDAREGLEALYAGRSVVR